MARGGTHNHTSRMCWGILKLSQNLFLSQKKEHFWFNTCISHRPRLARAGTHHSNLMEKNIARIEAFEGAIGKRKIRIYTATTGFKTGVFSTQRGQLWGKYGIYFSSNVRFRSNSYYGERGYTHTTIQVFYQGTIYTTVSRNRTYVSAWHVVTSGTY